jgi:geranylgeranyl diphosphate synthase, type I
MTIMQETLHRSRDALAPALREAVDRLDPTCRAQAAYHFGWCDEDGRPASAGGGKAVRPALALLSAEAAGAPAEVGLPGAVAVELVHNFSLLHDDVMDRDLERHHRPTGWAVFGEGQAILAGNAMLTRALEVLADDAERGRRALPAMLAATQRLISGQSDDLHFEGATAITVEDVLHMEAGKTAALLACSASIGALAAGAPAHTVSALSGFGHELGMAFQLVDDILGITGDPAVTGKSASSDVRAGKRSAPVVAALNAGTDASRRLADLLAGGAPSTDEDVVLATKLIEEAGGIDWAAREADAHLGRAVEHLEALPAPEHVVADLIALARYVVDRDH